MSKDQKYILYIENVYTKLQQGFVNDICILSSTSSIRYENKNYLKLSELSEKATIVLVKVELISFKRNLKMYNVKIIVQNVFNSNAYPDLARRSHSL